MPPVEILGFRRWVLFTSVALIAQLLSTHPATAVVGGYETSSFPAVQKLDVRSDGGVGLCTVNMLSDTVGITAAHCVKAIDINECRISRADETTFLNSYINDQQTTAVCAGGPYDCGVSIDGIRAQSCFVPKVYYVANSIYDKITSDLGMLILALMPRANDPQFIRDISNFLNSSARHDQAIVTFPQGTGRRLGLGKNDYIKISNRSAAQGSNVRLIGYGNNTTAQGDGAGIKRTGTNRIESIANGMIIIHGKRFGSLEDGLNVSSGSGDSGSVLLSNEPSTQGQAIGITSGGGALADRVTVVRNGQIVVEKRSEDKSVFAEILNKTGTNLRRVARLCSTSLNYRSTINCATFADVRSIPRQRPIAGQPNDPIRNQPPVRPPARPPVAQPPAFQPPAAQRPGSQPAYRIGIVGETLPQGGVLIKQTMIGGASVRSGLLAGDVITHIDNHPIRSSRDIQRIFNSNRPYQVHFQRGNLIYVTSIVPVWSISTPVR